MREVIFLFAGGSGGHIKPALLLKDKLEKRGSSVFLFLDKSYSDEKNSTLKELNVSRNKFEYFLKIPIIFFYILSLAILKKAKVFVGFGGYFTIPGILVASIVRAKAVIYEPNLIPGRTNRLLAHISDYIFVIWEETFKRYSEYLRKKIVRIRPLIRGIQDLKRKEVGAFSVLVTGGSQGSLFLNNLILNLVKNYEFNNRDLNLILICGKRFYSRFKKSVEFYSKYKNLRVAIYDYCSKIEQIYLDTDLLISRAGAQSLLESIYYLLPAIFIPYPYAYGHQIENAKRLYSLGAVYLLRQEVVDWKLLGDYISYFQKTPQALERIQKELKKIKRKLEEGEDAGSFILSLKDG